MDAETDSGFMIDGKLYPVPDLGTFNMDEAQILYDYAGLGLEDFVVPDDADEDELAARAKALKNPGLLRALMHVAYARGNPDVRQARVKALIGNANVVASFEHLAGADEGDRPLSDTTKQPSESSPNAWDASNVNSGGASNGDTDEPEDQPAVTGTLKSPISPTSDPTPSDL